MDPALKQRLVGAAVIIALAVIFVPMFLDGSGTQPQVAEIPLQPDPPPPFEPAPIEVPQAPVASPARPLETPMAETPPATESAPERPPSPSDDPRAASAEPSVPSTERVADEDNAQAPVAQPGSSAASTEPGAGQLAGWAVQVGSFSEQSKAFALRDRLRKADFAAFVETYEQGARSMYRVRVGPSVDRAGAESMLGSLKSKLELNGYVTRHP